MVLTVRSRLDISSRHFPLRSPACLVLQFGAPADVLKEEVSCYSFQNYKAISQLLQNSKMF